MSLLGDAGGALQGLQLLEGGAEEAAKHDQGAKGAGARPPCPLHEHPPTIFRSNQKILVSLLRRLSPEVFQQQVEAIRRENPTRWKFPSFTEKSAIIQNARNDELLHLLPSQCTCLSDEQRQNIHRMAKLKMHSREKKK